MLFINFDLRKVSVIGYVRGQVLRNADFRVNSGYSVSSIHLSRFFIDVNIRSSDSIWLDFKNAGTLWHRKAH